MINQRLLALLTFLGYSLKIILILIPILIIVYGIIDLIKYLMNPENNKNYIKLFIKRLIYSLCVFFVTMFVFFLLKMLNQNVNSQSLKCFIDPNLCHEILKNKKDNINSCENIKNKNNCCKFILDDKNTKYDEDINDCTLPISNYM